MTHQFTTHDNNKDQGPIPPLTWFSYHRRKRKRISYADAQVNGGPKECTGGLNS